MTTSYSYSASEGHLQPMPCHIFSEDVKSFEVRYDRVLAEAPPSKAFHAVAFHRAALRQPCSRRPKL